MADTIRDVVIRLALEQEDISLTVPDTKPAVAEVNKLQEAIDDLFHEEPFENLDEALEDLSKDANTAAADVEQAAINIGESNVKIAESFRTAGEGAFTAARGIALLASSGEEDLQQMLATVAKVQGAFDIFKGSIDVVKGLREGLIALNTTMAATATTGQAVKVALGPLAIVAAAAGVAFLAFQKQTEEIPDQLEDVTDKIITLDEAIRTFKSSAGDPISLLKFQEGLISSEERLEQLDKLLERFTKQTLERLNREIPIAFGEEGFFSNTQSVREAIEALEELFAITKGGTGVFAEQDKRALERIIDLRSRLGQIERSRLEALRSQGQEIDKSLTKARQEIEAAERKVELEQEKLQSLKEQFGALSEAERIELRRIAAKVESGEQITLSEAEILERFDPRQARQIRSRIAEETGFGQFQQQLGFDEQLRQAQSDAEETRSANQEQIDTLGRLRDENQNRQQEQIALLRDILDDLAQNRQDVAELNARLQQDAQRAR